MTILDVASIHFNGCRLCSDSLRFLIYLFFLGCGCQIRLLLFYSFKLCNESYFPILWWLLLWLYSSFFFWYSPSLDATTDGLGLGFFTNQFEQRFRSTQISMPGMTPNAFPNLLSCASLVHASNIEFTQAVIDDFAILGLVLFLGGDSGQFEVSAIFSSCNSSFDIITIGWGFESRAFFRN